MEEVPQDPLPREVTKVELDTGWRPVPLADRLNLRMHCGLRLSHLPDDIDDDCTVCLNGLRVSELGIT